MIDRFETLLELKNLCFGKQNNYLKFEILWLNILKLFQFVLKVSRRSLSIKCSKNISKLPWNLLKTFLASIDDDLQFWNSIYSSCALLRLFLGVLTNRSNVGVSNIQNATARNQTREEILFGKFVCLRFATCCVVWNSFELWFVSYSQHIFSFKYMSANHWNQVNRTTAWIEYSIILFDFILGSTLSLSISRHQWRGAGLNIRSRS